MIALILSAVDAVEEKSNPETAASMAAAVSVTIPFRAVAPPSAYCLVIMILKDTVEDETSTEGMAAAGSS